MRAIANTVPSVQCEGCKNWTPMDRAIRQPDGTYNVLCDDCIKAGRSARKPQVVDLVAALRASMEAAKRRRLAREAADR